MKVVLTEKALSDLDEIADWLGQDDWERAEAFVGSLRRRCTSLARYPNRHPSVPRARGMLLRKLSYRGYLVFYTVLDDHVEILRIVHGARDWGALIGDDD